MNGVLLNNADQYGNFNDPNCNGLSCINFDQDLVTLTDLEVIFNVLFYILDGCANVILTTNCIESVTKIISKLN